MKVRRVLLRDRDGNTQYHDMGLPGCHLFTPQEFIRLQGKLWRHRAEILEELIG